MRNITVKISLTVQFHSKCLSLVKQVSKCFHMRNSKRVLVFQWNFHSFKYKNYSGVKKKILTVIISVLSFCMIKSCYLHEILVSTGWLKAVIN